MMSWVLRALFFFTFLYTPSFVNSFPLIGKRATTSTPKQVVIFGAGNIARGLLAPEIMKQIDGGGDHEWHITFIGSDPVKAQALAQKGSYKVTEVGLHGSTTTIVNGYDVLSSKTQEDLVVKAVTSSDIVLTAVGAGNIDSVAPLIAKGIAARSTTLGDLPVIACENGLSVNSDLEKAVQKSQSALATLGTPGNKAFFPQSIVDRVVPGSTNFDFEVEAYFSWIVDQQPFTDHGILTLPKIDAIHYVTDPQRYITQKLFTMNTAHAVAAYYGHSKGYQTIAEAMADPEIRAHVQGCLDETAALLVKKYGFTAQEMSDYDGAIMTRIENPALKDTVQRVGKGPLRKLADGERLTGAASQLADLNMDHQELTEAISVGATFTNVVSPDGVRDEESFQLGDLMKGSTSDTVTAQVTKLPPTTPLFRQVSTGIARVQVGYRVGRPPRSILTLRGLASRLTGSFKITGGGHVARQRLSTPY